MTRLIVLTIFVVAAIPAFPQSAVWEIILKDQVRSPEETALIKYELQRIRRQQLRVMVDRLAQALLALHNALESPEYIPGDAKRLAWKVKHLADEIQALSK